MGYSARVLGLVRSFLNGVVWSGVGVALEYGRGLGGRGLVAQSGAEPEWAAPSEWWRRKSHDGRGLGGRVLSLAAGRGLGGGRVLIGSSGAEPEWAGPGGAWCGTGRPGRGRGRKSGLCPAARAIPPGPVPDLIPVPVPVPVPAPSPPSDPRARAMDAAEPGRRWGSRRWRLGGAAPLAPRIQSAGSGSPGPGSERRAGASAAGLALAGLGTHPTRR